MSLYLPLNEAIASRALLSSTVSWMCRRLEMSGSKQHYKWCWCHFVHLSDYLLLSPFLLVSRSVYLALVVVMFIRTDLVYSHTGYDITGYFQSAYIGENCWQCCLTTLGWISQERFNQGSPNFTVMWMMAPINMPDMTSIGASGGRCKI